jgi:membrane protease YdiL (CAAX protease family)
MTLERSDGCLCDRPSVSVPCRGWSPSLPPSPWYWQCGWCSSSLWPVGAGTSVCSSGSATTLRRGCTITGGASPSNAGAALVGLLALLAHSRLRSLWPPGVNTAVAGQIPVLAVAIIAITAVYRFGGQTTRRALAVQLRPVAALLPRTPTERRWFALLAVTAGICEELLYRGFGLAALRWAAPNLGKSTLIILTGAAFGLAHLYQGRLGVTVTGILGAYFAWITIATGSLIPVVVLHALLDLRILGLPLDAVPLAPTPSASPADDGGA